MKRFLSLVILLSMRKGICQNNDDILITPITESFEHSEGPIWDERTNILYFVDIHQGNVYAYHYNTEELTNIHLDGDVTPVTVSENDVNLFYVGVNRSVVALEWDGYSKTPSKQRLLTTVSDEYPRSRFNDGKADRKGRLWWGTIGFEDSCGVVRYQGNFYKITSENFESPTIVIHSVSNSNGLAWNKANDKLYYIDTSSLKVVEFEFNLENGTISDHNRTVFDVAAHHNLTGVPDGMTIDEDDNLWIALYQGGAVINVNPTTGKLLRIIHLPVTYVTSVIWGGPNLDILYTTTSKIRLTEEERDNSPTAGCVFAIRNLGVKGLPGFGGYILSSL